VTEQAVATRKKVYLVQEVRWERDDWENPEWLYCTDPEAGAPVKAFTDANAAEKFRRGLERQARAGRNPFQHGRELAHLTSLPEGPLRDWLLDAGLTPPKEELNVAVLSLWWEQHSEGMPELQRDKVWEALDLLRFYTVVDLGTLPVKV
jgi:hypothetical protein